MELRGYLDFRVNSRVGGVVTLSLPVGETTLKVFACLRDRRFIVTLAKAGQKAPRLAN